MDYDKFINDYLGKPVDYDGVYGPQCVDLIDQYLHDNGKPVPWVVGAKDFANNPALLPAFDWIDNNPNDPNQLPTRGDIVVFSGQQPGSGGYGHINIFDMVTGVHSWQGLDQNWGGQTVHFVPNHIWTYVLGWWHVKETPVAVLTPVAPDPSPVITVPPIVPVVVVPTPEVVTPTVTVPVNSKPVKKLSWFVLLLKRIFRLK